LSSAPAQAVGSAIPTRSDAQRPGSTSPSSSRMVSAPAAPQGDAIAGGYECEEGGQRSLSDQRCSPSAKVVKIMAPNRMDAQDTSGLYRGSYASKSRSVSRPHRASYESESNICQSIEARIDAINARMRQAYTSQEGERLRRQLR